MRHKTNDIYYILFSFAPNLIMADESVVTENMEELKEVKKTFDFHMHT